MPIFGAMRQKKLYSYLSIFLVVQIVFVQLISNYPSFIERYYSNGIYPYISAFLRIIFGWLPFSIGDLLLVVLLFLFLRFLFRLIKSRFKNVFKKLIQLTGVLSIIYWCFYFFWGFNYFREPLSKNLGFEQTKYTTAQLSTVANTIVLKLNELQLQIAKSDSISVVVPYTSKEIYQKTRNGYESIVTMYPQLKNQYPSIKSSLMSLLQTYNGTSGYLNPLTGEAHVNKRIPKTSYPTTACHEIAHQIGFAAENEANFIGFLAAVSNQDLYFQYSGYRMAFAYVVSEVRKRDTELARTIWKTVHKGIVKDFQSSSNFWRQYQNPIEPLIKKGYSSYLKANKQDKGIASYNYVVDLLIAYFNSKG